MMLRCDVAVMLRSSASQLNLCVCSFIFRFATHAGHSREQQGANMPVYYLSSNLNGVRV